MPPLGIEESPILYVDFNQDFTCLCIGTQSGYMILPTVGDKANEIINIKSDPISMVNRLFTSNLVSLVSVNNVRKLLAYHFQRNALICEYQYSSPILAIKMNRKRLVVCVETSIFIHNILDMEMMHTVENTPSNRNGVIALSSCPDKGFLAYPGSQSTGTVFIFDTLTFTNVITIAAHDGLLAALAFNSSSTMLATASERGTVVRVFSIPGGHKLMEFRRGLVRCADIGCLSFSVDSQFLVSASNTETVHIFKLDPRTKEACNSLSDNYAIKNDVDTNASAVDESSNGNVPTGGSGGLMNWVGDTLKATAAYLPHQVSEVLSQDRAFAFARIPASSTLCNSVAVGTTLEDKPVNFSASTNGCFSLKKVAALIWTQHQYRLLVAGLEGLLHTYSFDHIHGGETTLLHSQSLLDPILSRDLPVTKNSKISGGNGTGLAVDVQSEPNEDRLHSKKKSSVGSNRRCFASVCAQEVLTPTERTAVELSDAASSHASADVRTENDSEFPDIQTATKVLQKRGQKPT